MREESVVLIAVFGAMALVVIVAIILLHVGEKQRIAAILEIARIAERSEKEGRC